MYSISAFRYKLLDWTNIDRASPILRSGENAKKKGVLIQALVFDTAQI
jgi:hypothetical protein